FDLVRWYQDQVRDVFGSYRDELVPHSPLGDPLLFEVAVILEQEVPGPEGWNPPVDGGARFVCVRSHPNIRAEDLYLGVSLDVPISLLNRHRFDLPNYYARHVRKLVRCSVNAECILEGRLDLPFEDAAFRDEFIVELHSVGAPTQDSLLTLQHTAASPHDFKRRVPEPVIVVVKVNGQPAHTLLDTGSLSDFMSTKLVHQLGIKPFELEKPLPVHLAVQGSRAKINLGCNADVAYQTIRETRYFDIINLLNYNLILGTPFLFQHQVFIGFNPAKVVVVSSVAQPLEGRSVRTLESHAADLFGDRLEEARRYLREYAAPICKEAQDSPLPPLQEINHTIPLKDEAKIYTWRPSKCPDALRAAWVEKRDAYLKS
ncbi:hypothetical protein OBBRIDRAFT_696850, partial [Obba rivulosa]